LALLVLSLPLFFLGTWLLKRNANKHRETGTPAYTMRDVLTLNAGALAQLTKRTAIAINTAQTIKFLLAFGLGCVGGYLYRDHLLATNTETLANVTIIRKHSALEFTMQTEKGQTFETQFCQDSLPQIDFEAGEKLQVMNYEQRPRCKSLAGKNLGYVAYTDSEGNRTKFDTGEVANVR